MAVSVASYTNIANWFVTTTPRTVTGVAWSAGDIVVVVGGNENAIGTMANPTNANLTFGAPKASSTSGGGAECTVYVWASAAAAGAQTGQTITSSATGGLQWGFAVIVLTGAPTGFANAIANLTEAAISRTVSAGSTGIYCAIDFNATNPPGKTPATGSGTAVERRDAGNGTNYAQYIATWEGMSAGTFSFGPNNYTSLQVAQCFIEITGSAGPSPITGTVAVTLDNFTSAASGVYTPPPVTGTTAVTLAVFTSAASGTSTPPSYTGTTAVTLAAFTSNASGTVAGPGAITGTVAATLAPFVPAASGTVTAPSYTGTVAVTLAAFTGSAVGTYTPPPITGTVAATLGVFVPAASGTVAGPGTIVGTATITLNPFTSTAAGTVTAPAVTGTAAPTLGPFLAVAAGTFTPAPIVGTVAAILGLFIAAASDAPLVVLVGPLTTGTIRHERNTVNVPRARSVVDVTHERTTTEAP